MEARCEHRTRVSTRRREAINVLPRTWEFVAYDVYPNLNPLPVSYIGTSFIFTSTSTNEMSRFALPHPADEVGDVSMTTRFRVEC
jgi:hypothetical protein